MTRRHGVLHKIYSYQCLVNRKNNGMVGARKVVASRLGAAVVDGREMRGGSGGAGRRPMR